VRRETLCRTVSAAAFYKDGMQLLKNRVWHPSLFV